MKRNKRKAVIVALGLAAVLAVGASIAFFMDQADAANKIKMGKLDVEVKETVTDTEKTDVGATVKAGSADCWVRVYVGIPTGAKVSNSQDESATELFDKTYADGFDQNWKLGEDGYYYYQTVVKENDTSDQNILLFKSIKSKEGLDSQKVPPCTDIIVYTEAVQEEFGISAQEAFANRNQVENNNELPITND